MKPQSIKKHSATILLIGSGLILSQFMNPSIDSFISTFIKSAHADWSSEKLYRGYNRPYGSFPPLDIDQKLADSDNTSKESATQATQPNPTTGAANTNTRQPAVNQPPNYNTQQNYQQPTYGAYNHSANQGRNYYPPQNRGYNRNNGFNGPTSVNGPWNNNRSNFNGPWNNNGSNFSGPWNGSGNNNGSNFNMPWGNNNGSGSGFNMPWGNNNGSGFNPMGNGNGGGWSW